MSDDTQPSAESWFHELATHYVLAQALFHLNRCGVFEFIDRRGPCRASDLASSLGLESEHLETLLEYVTGVDRLLARDAEGAYGFTPWGLGVLERYGRAADDGTRSFNFFDVRVGAYGPVWAALGGLLRGEERYGESIKRHGEEAAQGVYKVGARIAPAVGRIMDRLGATTLVELGVTSGLCSRVGATRPGLSLLGLDRDARALEEASRRARAEGVDRIGWVEVDVFDLDEWTGQLDAESVGVITTVHFHEMMAAGEERLVDFLKGLSERLPGWCVVALEQPLLAESQRAETSSTLWRYNHSNVLIHHLIGNGRILSDAAWRALFKRAGLASEQPQGLNYLGYQAYTLPM